MNHVRRREQKVKELKQNRKKELFFKVLLFIILIYNIYSIYNTNNIINKNNKIINSIVKEHKQNNKTNKGIVTVNLPNVESSINYVGNVKILNSGENGEQIEVLIDVEQE